MGALETRLEPELHLSGKVAIGGLVGLCMVLWYQCEDLPLWPQIELLLLIALLTSVLAWVLYDRNPLFGNWFLLIQLSGLIWLCRVWLSQGGLLPMLALPTALAAVLVGVGGSFAMASGASILSLLCWHGAWADLGQAEIVATLIATWALAGIMYAAYRPTLQLRQWVWDYHQHAQILLEQARDRQLELHQALDGLAHANRQLALFNQKWAAQRLVAEEAEKSKAAFLARVSHEFRTPLNIIIGLAELMADTPEVFDAQVPPPILRHLRTLRRNAEHLAHMVNDVLDLSQIQTGKLVLHREHVDLGDTVRQALEVVGPLAADKGLLLTIDIPQDLPQVDCDPTRILQVILNLVGNAVRYTDQGGISVRLEADDNWITVSVSDTGPGICSRDAAMIFEPFSQGTPPPTAKKGGSGLGLSISRQFVEVHGGRIWYESPPGGGSKFSFTLSVSPPPAPIARPSRWISEDWGEPPSRANVPPEPLRQRVILCDSSGQLRPLLARLAGDVELAESRDLQEAKRELQRTPAHSLVLNAPSAEGLRQLFQQARVEVADTPIIGCCCSPQPERAGARQVLAYLIKPVTRARLQSTLQAVGKPIHRVLLVDDEPDTLELLDLELRSLDGSLEIATAATGEQALNSLRADAPDLVLLDIVLPDMSGWDVLALKDNEARIRDIPVVVVSAQDISEQPTSTPLLMATVGEGLSLTKFWECSRILSAVLVQPDTGPRPGHR